MTVTLIILSIVLWVLSLGALLSKRQILAPLSSYLALLALSFARKGPFPLLPVNGTILIGWLCMTVVVMLILVLQPPAVAAQTRGTAYMTVGAIVGMAVGLLASTFTSSLAILYAAMVIGVVAGVFFSFILFTNTPRGAEVALPTRRFFPYLLAKGFPIAITVMIIGVALVLVIATNMEPQL